MYLETGTRDDGFSLPLESLYSGETRRLLCRAKGDDKLLSSSIRVRPDRPQPGAPPLPLCLPRLCWWCSKETGSSTKSRCRPVFISYESHRVCACFCIFTWIHVTTHTFLYIASEIGT